MNILDIADLSSGVLFKGIDNSKLGTSILSLDGWNNSETGSYMIRWHRDEDIRVLNFDCLNHQALKYPERISSLTPSRTAKNGDIYIAANKHILYDRKIIQIGKPIGMFLGESIFCSIYKAENFLVLLRILAEKEVGWIVLKCPDVMSRSRSFEIY